MFLRQKKHLLRKVIPDLPDPIIDILMEYTDPFSRELKKVILNRIIQDAVPGFPYPVIDEIIGLSEDSLSQAEQVSLNDELLADMFAITEHGWYFLRHFYTDYSDGSYIVGVMTGGVGIIYLGIPFFLIDALINCCIESDDDKSFKFYATKIPYCFTAIIGTLLGLVISIIPAAIAAAFKMQHVSQTNQLKPLSSGKEIYETLTILEKATEKNTEKANRIITQIVNAYEESFHGKSAWDCPGLLFPCDQKSEQLYRQLQLKEEDFSLQEKAAAIAEYMQTKNRNAGKKLFEIILDKIKSTPDYMVNSTYQATDYNDYTYIYAGI